MRIESGRYGVISADDEEGPVSVMSIRSSSLHHTSLGSRIACALAYMNDHEDQSDGAGALSSKCLYLAEQQSSNYILNSARRP